MSSAPGLDDPQFDLPPKPRGFLELPSIITFFRPKQTFRYWAQAGYVGMTAFGREAVTPPSLTMAREPTIPVLRIQRRSVP